MMAVRLWSACAIKIDWTANVGTSYSSARTPVASRRRSDGSVLAFELFGFSRLPRNSSVTLMGIACSCVEPFSDTKRLALAGKGEAFERKPLGDACP